MKYNTAATVLYQYALLCEEDSGKSNNLAAFFVQWNSGTQVADLNMPHPFLKLNNYLRSHHLLKLITAPAEGYR